MFRKRVHKMSQPVKAVSLSARCLVGVFLLHNPASVLAQLIQIGEPERVFSMDDFPSISNKNINYMDVTSDGGKVAFSTFPGGGLYVYQADGQAGDPTQIGAPPGPDTITQTMRFSRDDTKLFYSWDGPETSAYDIWVANTDGSGASELFGDAGSQGHTCPAVVNEECRLLYREGSWPIDIWSADCTSGDRIQLTSGGNYSAPYASVDGTRIVYMSQDTALCHDIFLMNADGSEQQAITNDGLTIEECYPVLADNHLGDEVILYLRMNPSTGNAEIWVTDLDGMQQQPLITVQDRHLNRIDYVPNDPISPYGAIYYTSRPGSGGASEFWRVAVIDPAAIPTLSEWGVVAMTLLLLTAGTIVFARRRKPSLG